MSAEIHQLLDKLYISSRAGDLEEAKKVYVKFFKLYDSETKTTEYDGSLYRILYDTLYNKKVNVFKYLIQKDAFKSVAHFNDNALYYEARAILSIAAARLIIGISNVSNQLNALDKNITSISVSRNISSSIKNIIGIRHQQRLTHLKNEADIKSEIRLYQNELKLINFYKIDYLYLKFLYQCKSANKLLDESVISDVFSMLIEVLLKIKLKLTETICEQDVKKRSLYLSQKPDEKREVITWTESYAALVHDGRVQLENLFAMLFPEMNKHKVILYTKKGLMHEEVVQSGISKKFIPAVIIENIADSLLACLAYRRHDGRYVFSSVDSSFETIIWAILSTQYVLNSNGQDIDVYLPNGAISTNSILWNNELNAINLYQAAADKHHGKVHFFRLKTEKQKMLDDMIKSNENKPDNINHSCFGGIYIDERNILGNNQNWEEIPFEKVQIEGLNIGGRPYTIGDLQKTAKKMLAFYEKNKRKESLEDDKENTPTNSMRKKI